MRVVCCKSLKMKTTKITKKKLVSKTKVNFCCKVPSITKKNNTKEIKNEEQGRRENVFKNINGFKFFLLFYLLL